MIFNFLLFAIFLYFSITICTNHIYLPFFILSCVACWHLSGTIATTSTTIDKFCNKMCNRINIGLLIIKHIHTKNKQNPQIQ